MKNIIQALAFMLIGGLLYYYVIAPQLDKTKRHEQFVLAPQVFLYTLELQSKANLDSFQNTVEGIERKLEQPKLDIAMITKDLKSQVAKFKEQSSRLSALKAANEESYILGTKGPGGVPTPPPPPPPCLGCGEFIINVRDPFVIYSRTPLNASVFDKDGKEIVSSLAGSASQQAIGSNFKITFNLPASAIGNGTLQLEDKSLNNIAKLGVSIK